MPGNAFAGVIRIVRKVVAEALHFLRDRRHRGHADHVQLARRRVVEIDHGRAADGVGNAAGGIVELFERRLHGHRVDAEVGETFGAAAAPRFALRGLALVGDVARKHDRSDDVILDRRESAPLSD